MFNTATKYSLKLLREAGDKSVNLRFPTDEELSARARRLVAVYKGGARGEIKNQGEVELDFISKLREDGDTAGELSEGEATYLVDRLLRVAVVDGERDGNTFRITLKVSGGQVVHILRIPSIDAAQKYERSVTVREVKRNRVESYETLSGVAPFWDAIGGTTEGYAEGSNVPLNHKEAAIAELIGLMRAAMEDSDPEI